MKVSAGTRGSSFSSNRQVTITVTGLVNNSYVRSSDCTMQIPYVRMNDTLRLVNRLGGKVTAVTVSGGDIAAVAPPARKSKKRAEN
ncbi:CpcD/allophycocyanin linker domain-containing protein [Synechococcus sp. CS-1325]|uniref:phycobilisome linker polypeptide n=1 Tax=Synechococcus sp. CS-1325 TaxID=2847979 RepID=UPI000DB3A7A3|nr:phycobilisome linker polypeptide [Synechococcus sp. CS-1325]MCT0198832.1 CpcD/allophycocyanin linker domain-containing protein [Synechococcus sp. CS-1325]PZV00062.1 MAG: CpcD/allophycocyanin linker domain-containing protein [Cyanobium sp.]